ncbi:MAG TPA: SPFH domain-containing protein [Candidatus Dormibacteraeota bacterium]|nr:SPFH domain-containing protein [Candidatus Dormibacteraeota bacterium]
MVTNVPPAGVPADTSVSGVHERPAGGLNGLPVLGVGLLALLGAAGLLTWGIGMTVSAGASATEAIWVAVALIVVGAPAMRGLTQVVPGEARVVQLFGRYTGTVRSAGLRWVNPFAERRRVSTRIRNHETAVAKVNDADGNPIEIAAVVVWQVEDTARAVYAVEDVVAFVGIQTETAVRHVATSYPYDAHGDGQPSLRQNAEEINGKLTDEIQARVSPAGVRVIESRLTRLAFAPEIAQVMLRRQQAEAVVAARQRIVDGAVGMVEQALARLEERDFVELDQERKAAMVSNLLVVLCSDHATQPVVNTGSLYH